MRIGMILDKQFPPDPRVENEAISLIEAGHQVFLFCLSYDKYPLQEKVNGINVCRFSSSKLEYKLSALAYSFPFYSKIMEKKIGYFLSENNIEVIHIHDIQIAQAVFNANKQFQLPTVLDLHENRPEIMKFYPHLKTFPGKYLISPKVWKNKEEVFVNKAKKVVVVTNEAREEILSRTHIVSNDICVVPNTVRKGFFKAPKIDANLVKEFDNKFVLLYIGDTGDRRGLSTAIATLHSLKNDIPEILLVIVGASTNDSNLLQQVKDLSLENYVDFRGWQDASTFASYISSSAICISPLHQNRHHDTTYANKIFQYMSFGKPVLVSDVKAQKNVIEHANAGLIHKERDSEDFALKVNELYANDGYRIKLGENGKYFVQNEFYWEKTSKELIKLYSDIKS
ncbi:glycosyltransferase family 4 protein [Urechidicola vernalis]|uniref:Glycosyltransferase family 4 protein n=1 Tax=Urechidicola vernalis TaxID=3075600 RepID=A0ABU2Y7Z6_9FLAO|nr:glycosyltransferase family 4 protein [Urechidicola sp. P050]MDT0554311.1 glycosyltransferase family 4 protein [Urechidicola sp. P050]